MGGDGAVLCPCVPDAASQRHNPHVPTVLKGESLLGMAEELGCRGEIL